MKLRTKLAASAFVISPFIAGCIENNEYTTLNTAMFDIVKSNIGKTFNDPGVLDLCRNPDFQINQQTDCTIVTEKDSLTVEDVTQTRGFIFVKVRLYDGREGYIGDDEFRIIEQFSHPGPKIGMTESQAYETNWGFPEKKNVTVRAGHRSEQWVFPSRGYLYIEDGILTTIQRTE